MKHIDDIFVIKQIKIDIDGGGRCYYVCLICQDGYQYAGSNIDKHVEDKHMLYPVEKSGPRVTWGQKQRVVR